MSRKTTVDEKLAELAASLAQAIQGRDPCAGLLNKVPYCILFNAVKEGLGTFLLDLDVRETIAEVGDALEDLYMLEQEERDKTNAILLAEQAEMAANATSRAPFRNLFLCTTDPEAWA
jgi:hypothetical protein